MNGREARGMMLRSGHLVQYLTRANEVIAATRHTSAIGPLVRRYLDIGKPAYPFQLRLSNGATLTLGCAEEAKIFWHIFVRGCYRLPARCDTVLDCGANIGIFSTWAAFRRPQARIVALEPCPDTFASLEANVGQNGLENRIQCVKAAVAAAAGVRRMDITRESPQRKLLHADADAPVDRTAAVECFTLRDALDRFGFETLDLLKMDIEGSEWEVLLSTPASTLAAIRAIHLEYHRVHARFRYTPEKLFAHLALAGHQVVSRVQDAHGTGLAYFERG